MGYRLVLRKFTYPRIIRPGGQLAFTSWWDNQGVAPCYRKFPLALRLKNAQRAEVLLTGADITAWLPGDSLCDRTVPVAADLSAGDYELALAMLDPHTKLPKVKLAIAGRQVRRNGNGSVAKNVSRQPSRNVRVGEQDFCALGILEPKRERELAIARRHTFVVPP